MTTQTSGRETWSRVREIFGQALPLSTIDRDRLLRERCHRDPETARILRELLGAHHRAGAFLEGPRDGARWRATGGSGRKLGPYALVQSLGGGGMGVVFLAVDSRAPQRWLAIKMLRTGVEGAEALARFRFEQAILASLAHPGIVTLIDHGSTENDEPFLVMEYVDGLPIDRFCDRSRLPVEQRIQRFLGVCEAVQAAHDSRIVHRDLKPSNILVDRQGSPRLLDFGIAKLLDEEPGSPKTSTGPGPMTPDYASPEQMLGEPITPASDVYSLGVLLYLLVCGRPPYPFGAPPLLMARAVCELQPLKPSRALLRRPRCFRGKPSGEGAEVLAWHRSTSVPALREQLQGPLDSVVLRALDKSPQRRHTSASHLAAELRELCGDSRLGHEASQQPY